MFLFQKKILFSFLKILIVFLSLSFHSLLSLSSSETFKMLKKKILVLCFRDIERTFRELKASGEGWVRWEFWLQVLWQPVPSRPGRNRGRCVQPQCSRHSPSPPHQRSTFKDIECGPSFLLNVTFTENITTAIAITEVKFKCALLTIATTAAEIVRYGLQVNRYSVKLLVCKVNKFLSSLY